MRETIASFIWGKKLLQLARGQKSSVRHSFTRCLHMWLITWFQRNTHKCITFITAKKENPYFPAGDWLAGCLTAGAVRLNLHQNHLGARWRSGDWARPWEFHPVSPRIHSSHGMPIMVDWGPLLENHCDRHQNAVSKPSQWNEKMPAVDVKLSKISKPEFTIAHAVISQSSAELTGGKACEATCQNYKAMIWREQN